MLTPLSEVPSSGLRRQRLGLTCLTDAAEVAEQVD